MQYTLSREDFRLRKVGSGYKVSQRVGSGWELLADVHASKRDAEEFIRATVDGN